MNKQIWKFQLTSFKMSIDVPIGAEILSVQMQGDIPCIWLLVNPKAPTQSRYFEIYGTGTDIPYDMGIMRNYIGTYQLDNGDFIFHVFERIN